MDLSRPELRRIRDFLAALPDDEHLGDTLAEQIKRLFKLADDDAAYLHLKQDLFKPCGWWTKHQPLAPKCKRGLIDTIDALLLDKNLRKPVVSVWIEADKDEAPFQITVFSSGQQITVIVNTPKAPKPRQATRERSPRARRAR